MLSAEGRRVMSAASALCVSEYSMQNWAANRVRRAFLYMDDLPRATGSGAQVRFYSNVCAYLDNGFDVEVVRVTSVGAIDQRDATGLPYQLAVVAAQPATASLMARVSYRLALPNRSACRYYFPKYDL